jgi:hypothetical protein
MSTSKNSKQTAPATSEDDVLRRMLTTPPKPHETKVAQPIKKAKRTGSSLK